MSPAARNYIERLWERAIPEPNSGCLLWTGYVQPQRGYGMIRVGRTMKLTHRVAYELTKGPIPDGLELDHKCRVRSCMNPDHLEPVTHLENIRRGHNATKSHCVNGHPLSGQNIIARGNRLRLCLECVRTRGTRPVKHTAQTHCKNGHPFDGDNLRISSNGQRRCRICSRDNTRRRRLRLSLIRGEQ